MSHITRRTLKLDHASSVVNCQAEVGIAPRRDHPADAPLYLLGGGGTNPAGGLSHSDMLVSRVLPRRRVGA